MQSMLNWVIRFFSTFKKRVPHPRKNSEIKKTENVRSFWIFRIFLNIFIFHMTWQMDVLSHKVSSESNRGRYKKKTFSLIHLGNVDPLYRSNGVSATNLRSRRHYSFPFRSKKRIVFRAPIIGFWWNLLSTVDGRAQHC